MELCDFKAGLNVSKILQWLLRAFKYSAVSHLAVCRRFVYNSNAAAPPFKVSSTGRRRALITESNTVAVENLVIHGDR